MVRHNRESHGLFGFVVLFMLFLEHALDVRRILFLGCLLICAVPALLWADEVNVPDAERTGLSFPCASGDVTSDGVVLWARTAMPTTIRMEYGTDLALVTPRRTAMVETTQEADLTAQWVVSGLKPKTLYFYRARVKGKEPGRVCQFMTAPAHGDTVNVQFAVGSDMGEKYQPFTILGGIQEKKPDFLLLLGDTVYADMGFRFARTLPEFHQRNAANRNDEALQRLLASTSVYVTWDDHEVMDNYQSSFVLAPLGQQAFLNYWPVRRHPGEARRLYRSFRWGTAIELFLLDTRQYRSSKNETMLGEAQKEWLLSGLRASTASFKVIATSVPFTATGFDQWGGYPRERDEIRTFISANNIKGVVFLSGDVHYAAVAPVPGGDGIKEFITGPLAQLTRYPAHVDGLEYWLGGEASYLFVEVNVENGEPDLKVIYYNQAHDAVYRTRAERQNQ